MDRFNIIVCILVAYDGIRSMMIKHQRILYTNSQNDSLKTETYPICWIMSVDLDTMVYPETNYTFTGHDSSFELFG